MGTPFYQGVNPPTTPDPVTPAADPGDPAGYDRVTPPGTSPAPAPYDISAPQDISGISAAFTAANSLAGAGVNVAASMGPRQRATEEFLNSPQGFGAMSITEGFPDYEDTNVNPGADLATPIQGEMSYPVGNTYQLGVPQFTAGLGAGVEGVTPEGGNMGPGGGDYPGTMQPGVPQYG